MTEFQEKIDGIATRILNRVEKKVVTSKCPWVREGRCLIDHRACQPKKYRCEDILNREWTPRYEFILFMGE